MRAVALYPVVAMLCWAVPCAWVWADDQAADEAARKVDIVRLEARVNGETAYTEAASRVFEQVLRPYYEARGDAAAQAAILARMQFACSEDLRDPTSSGGRLRFPVALLPGSDAVLWHRYDCTFSLAGPVAAHALRLYSSPHYTINQLDIRYGAVTVEPAVALQNYPVNGGYAFMGRYVQPLDLLLRDAAGQPPAAVLAGVNGGYDYRVDAWASNGHNDNICPPRYSATHDTQQFYSHPAPAQCPMGPDSLPSCAVAGSLPIADDLGDSLVQLSPAVRARSWRSGGLQSWNCGGRVESLMRGSLLLAPQALATRRISALRDPGSELQVNGAPTVSALGAGPLLIEDGHFVYDQPGSEEGYPLDNYELGGATGAGYAQQADGSTVLHLVNIEGDDNSSGLHDWMLGLYFLGSWARADGAVALGNGGDASFWVNPAGAAVQAVLADPADANHGYFAAVFGASDHPGVVSNCSGFAQAAPSCRARPVHDGLFVYQASP